VCQLGEIFILEVGDNRIFFLFAASGQKNA
jgi:hypothetical protein